MSIHNSNEKVYAAYYVYTPEIKMKALALLDECSLDDAALKLNIPPSTINTWLRRRDKFGLDSLMKDTTSSHKRKDLKKSVINSDINYQNNINNFDSKSEMIKLMEELEAMKLEEKEILAKIKDEKDQVAQRLFQYNKIIVEKNIKK